MNPQPSVFEHTPSADVRASLRVVHEVSALACIFDADVSAVVLRRPLAAEVTHDAGYIARLPDFRTLLQVREDARLHGELTTRLPPAPAVVSDIARWIDVLSDLTECTAVGVRLARLSSAMCPRFHVDKLMLRLIVTYAGAGTELSAGVVSCGDVLLLKGEDFPDFQGQRVLHRSPEASPAAPRVVLTLDTVWEAQSARRGRSTTPKEERP